jgi:uncharacterized protein YegJ (DUF2314 family)
MNDELHQYRESDARMGFAIEDARRTLRTFFDAFVSPKPNQKSFLLKVLFENGQSREHIWVADINASVFPLEGTVAIEPKIPGLKFMQRANFHRSQITDWMFVEDGYLVGGFTTQVIRAELSPEQRAKHDAGAPYKFR